MWRDKVRRLATDQVVKRSSLATGLIRCAFKILILTYQAYHGTAPQYLCDLIVPYANTCNLRFNNKLLNAPCHPRAKLKTYVERSFQHAAPKEWNNVPLDIRDSPSLAIFKSKLKTFLFKSAFIL